MGTRETTPSTIAVESARNVAREVVKHGPLSRSETARRLDLSPASLTRLTKPLVETGLLIEGEDRADPQHGRLIRPIDVSADLRFIGVKVTLDAVHGVVTTARAVVTERLEAPLEATDPATVTEAVADVVRLLLAREPRAVAVGVALGGHSSDGRVVDVSRSLDWHGVPLGDDLARATGLPTVVENDVLALTQAQHWFGTARGLRDFALVTVGVGVGCSLVIADQVVRREDPDTPTVGHYVIDRSGPVCPDGHRGCAIAYLSSPAMCSAVSLGLGRPVGYDELLQLAADGDVVASRVVRESAEALGRLISAVSTLTGIQNVQLSGEGIGLASIAPDAVEAGIAVDRPAWARPLTTTIQPMGFDEWARGGAVVALQAWLDRYPVAFTAAARNAESAAQSESSVPTLPGNTA